MTINARALLLAFLTDVVAVVVFCGLGMISHEETVSLAVLMVVVWPFLLGTVVGWASAYLVAHLRSVHLYAPNFAPWRIYPSGLLVWVLTVVVGMLMRHYATTRGVEVSFVIVASIVTGVFLLGWRGIAALIRRRTTHPARK